ncbi:hypothetical protein KR200_006190, partial [Drosophila serrata]
KRNLSQISDLGAKLKLNEIHLAYQKDKVKDKDELIRVLQDSIELIKKTNKIAINQVQKSETGFGTASNDNNFQKQKDSLESITLKDDVNNLAAQLKEWKCQAKNSDESHGKDDHLEKLQAQFDKCKKQNSELTVELDELKAKIIKYQKTEDGLRKQVSELKDNFLSVSAKLKESCEKLSENTLDIFSSSNKKAIIPLNYTRNPKIRVIERNGMQPFMAVIEDIPSAGSGWMVIQCRIDEDLMAFGVQKEAQYRDGFGDINKSFWLGTDIIHKLTTSQCHELYIQLVDFDNVSAYARYDHFEVGSREEKYMIKSLGSYSGNAGDAFRSLQNAPLELVHINKSLYFWWLNAQTNCNLNGTYKNATRFGFYWGSWSLDKRGCILKSCRMLIRPKP